MKNSTMLQTTMELIVSFQYFLETKDILNGGIFFQFSQMKQTTGVSLGGQE